MADKRFSIYYLLDPETGRVRYVGCSCRPSARFEDHLKARGESHRARWQRQLRAKGLQPTFVVKCIVQTEVEMFRIEMALIAVLRANGEPLTNMTAGGEGIINPTAELRAKKSAGLKGNTRGLGAVHSEESRRRASESRKRFNEEHPEVVARIALKQIGNTRGSNLSKEGREQKRILMLRNRQAGYVWTPEQRVEASKRMLGNQNTRGHIRSEETRTKHLATIDRKRAAGLLVQSTETKVKRELARQATLSARKLALFNHQLDIERDSED